MTDSTPKKVPQPFTCGSCAAGVPIHNDQVQCRFMPPTPFIVGVQQHPLQGMPPQPVVNCFFPVLADHFWCRQYQARNPS
jgi:hypothetical protein